MAVNRTSWPKWAAEVLPAEVIGEIELAADGVAERLPEYGFALERLCPGDASEYRIVIIDQVFIEDKVMLGERALGSLTRLEFGGRYLMATQWSAVQALPNDMAPHPSDIGRGASMSGHAQQVLALFVYFLGGAIDRRA